MTTHDAKQVVMISGDTPADALRALADELDASGEALSLRLQVVVIEHLQPWGVQVTAYCH
jgi:hypothetical protein